MSRGGSSGRSRFRWRRVPLLAAFAGRASSFFCSRRQLCLFDWFGEGFLVCFVCLLTEGGAERLEFGWGALEPILFLFLLVPFILAFDIISSARAYGGNVCCMSSCWLPSSPAAARRETQL